MGLLDICPMVYLPGALFALSTIYGALRARRAQARSQAQALEYRQRKFDLTKVARKNIVDLEPYRCARDDYSEGVLLDANENSIGPAVLTPSNHLVLNRYPDPLHLDVKEKFCRFRGGGIKKEQVFFGVGSDEAIDILFRIFCVPRKDNVLVTPPTYGMYKVCANVNEVTVKTVLLTKDFDVDVPSTLACLDENTKLLFLCSPGNPTSRVIPNSVVESILKVFTWGVVVVDEAYIDFAGTESACCLVNRYPNVVVLQTLSKAFGLAGIRLGMAIAQEPIIQLMNNVKAPYNINKLTIDIASKTFDDLSIFRSNVQILLKEREFLQEELRKFSAVEKIFPSQANYLLFRIAKAKEIYLAVADRGVVCRYRGTEPHCDSCLRVTVGTHEENLKFISLLKEVAGELGVR